jgi:Protein of unknown function (DUF732)
MDPGSEDIGTAPAPLESETEVVATEILATAAAPEPRLAYSEVDDVGTVAAPKKAKAPAAQPATEAATWGQVWGTAVVLIMCGALVGGVIAIAAWVSNLVNGPVPPLPPAGQVGDSVSQAAPAAPEPTTVPPGVPACHIDLDTHQGTPCLLPTPAAPVTDTETPTPPPTTVTVQAAPPPTVTVEAPPPHPPAPSPRMSDNDRAFIDTLIGDNIIVTSPTKVIEGGREVCQYIAAGHTAHDAVGLARSSNPTLTPENAMTYVGAAIGSYCPQYGGSWS